MTGKHILVVTQYFYPEVFRINDICTDLVERGYKVTVVTGIPNYPQGEFYEGYSWTKNTRETWNGIDIIRIPIFPRGHSKVGLMLNTVSFVTSGWLWKLLTKIDADCVFTFEVSPMTQALVGVWYAKKKKIPHYIYVQDLWPENVQVVLGINFRPLIWALQKITDYIYRGSDKIFGTSPSFVKAIQARIPEKPEIVEYLPQYAEDFYRPAEPSGEFGCLNDEIFKIVFTGNLGEAQGLGVLPKVAEELRRRGTDDVAIVMVGDGRGKEALMKEIADRNTGDMFRFIGKQQPENIPGILAACDVAFVSFMETPLFAMTIPAKMQSYLACEMPVLAVAGGETERIINEADCGICCSFNDIEAIADAVTLMKNSADLERWGRNAGDYFRDNFEKKMLMDRIEGIF